MIKAMIKTLTIAARSSAVLFVCCPESVRIPETFELKRLEPDTYFSVAI